MITFHEAEQGTPEWLEARKGRITGSCFKKARDKLAKGGFSKKAILYARDVARQRCGGKPEDVFQNAAMKFGTLQEPEARRAYETTTGYMVREVGFAATDCGWYGLSPDGIIDEDGGGVFECKTMVGSDNLFETVVEEDYSEYMDQCLGYLLFLPVQWVDLVLWTPDLEEFGLGLVIHRIYKKDHTAALAALQTDLDAFKALVQKLEFQLRAKAKANIALLQAA